MRDLLRVTPRAKAGMALLTVLLAYIAIEEVKTSLFCQEVVLGEGDYHIRHVVRHSNGSVEYPLADRCPKCNANQGE